MALELLCSTVLCMYLYTDTGWVGGMDLLFLRRYVRWTNQTARSLPRRRAPRGTLQSMCVHTGTTITYMQAPKTPLKTTLYRVKLTPSCFIYKLYCSATKQRVPVPSRKDQEDKKPLKRFFNMKSKDMKLGLQLSVSYALPWNKLDDITSTHPRPSNTASKGLMLTAVDYQMDKSDA